MTTASLLSKTCLVGTSTQTFEPACRNNWHIHHAKKGGGQILIAGYIGSNLLLMARGGITIEDGAWIAANVQLLSNNHDLYDRAVLQCKPVLIKEDAWLGAGVSVLPGVCMRPAGNRLYASVTLKNSTFISRSASGTILRSLGIS